MAAVVKKMLEPVTVGDLTLPNRFVMAPLTRTRATEAHVPTETMAEMYSQRASAGLLIAEATMVQDKQSAFYLEPGCYTDEQVAGWKLTTDAVHANGGRIFLQIWHGGRTAHPGNNDGEQPVSSVAEKAGHTVQAEFAKDGEKHDYSVPRALSDDEVKAMVQTFVEAAKKAVAAGFDGVEIHGANGYLIDQFWRAGQAREGPYGGSMENRARFGLEVTQAVAAAIGKGKVGYRISPLNSYNDMKDADPEGLTAHLAAELSKIGIAYLHVMRADFFGVQKGDVVTPARKNFKGAIFVNMGYELAEAEAVVESGVADAVAFGTKFLANPDLVARAAGGKALNDPKPQLFYARGPEGYTDYTVAEN